jgi:predicted transcriptional regulator of viral defense system
MIRNKNVTVGNTLMELVKGLPFFSIEQLTNLDLKPTYLRILLSRYESNGKLIRLKKGLYVSRSYIDTLEKRSNFAFYDEFLSGIIYKPSYLSFEYILYQHNLLTEMPSNFTCATLNKTMAFQNSFGVFFYHSIKKELFTGYKTIFQNGWMINKASKAKALFDFLYIRKNSIVTREALEELRLNLDELTKKDKLEMEKYGKQVLSKKLTWILKDLM